MEDWSLLVCQSSSISQSEPLEISVSSWTGMDPPLCWFGLMKGGKVFAGGRWENCQCRGLSLIWKGTAKMFSPANTSAETKRRARIMNFALQNFLTLTNWTFKKHNALVDLYNCRFCCRFFVSILSKLGFWIKRRPQDRYTHREEGQQRAHRRAFGQSRYKWLKNRSRHVGGLINSRSGEIYIMKHPLTYRLFGSSAWEEQ